MRGSLRPIVVITVALAVGAASIAAYATDALRRLEADTVDARFELRETKRPGDVVFVAIDDVTFDELRLQWPFPRSLHGRAIDRLRKAGARTIGYDVQFTEPSDPDEDGALYDALYRTPGVVLGTTEVGDRGATNVLGGDDNLRDAGARAANTSLPNDSGAIRRVPHSLEGLESFAVAVAERARRRPIERSALPENGALIDFAGPPGTIPTVSFSRLVRGKVPASFFRGKIVVLGASAPTLQDVHPTPTSGSELMPGPEVHANAIVTALRGFPLREAPFILGTGLVLLMALAAPLAGMRLRPLAAAGAALALGAVYLVVAKLVFDSGTILPVVYPLGALALGTVATLGLNYVAESRERRRVRAVFARFVPEQVVDEVLDHAGGEPRLGGVQLVSTVMFCDLRGFTSFSERATAPEVIEVLNRYLTEMSDAILAHGGTLVSYMGDGIMAVFGSPLETDDHARAAFAAAREMIEVRLPRFNAWLRERGHSEGDFRMGIGLNTGTVMSGNVGSERRLEYAAIGDTTNVAARLEAMTKETPFQVLVADSTRTMLDGDAEALVDAGEREVRGRDRCIRVWGLADAGSVGSDEPASIAAAV